MNTQPTTSVLAIIFFLTLFITWLLTRITHFIFQKFYTIHKGIHLRFFERLISAIIMVAGVILAISFFVGMDDVWKTVLGGTAFASGVFIFAAQDAIKDILAGMMISIYKPIELGNRIELENGTAGIVIDISMRHVVLQLLDSQVLIIPNSKLNDMSIRNFGYHSAKRAASFQFRVAYSTNVEKAMQVARDAIIDSPYSIPGKVTPGGMDYAPLYFMAYEQSSLLLATTVYFEPTVPSEVLISDINLRVSKAFRKHGIEVPYPYINVISKQPFVENGQSHGDRSHGSTRARGTGTVAAHEPARSLVA